LFIHFNIIEEGVNMRNSELVNKIEMLIASKREGDYWDCASSRLEAIGMIKSFIPHIINLRYPVQKLFEI